MLFAAAAARAAFERFEPAKAHLGDGGSSSSVPPATSFFDNPQCCLNLPMLSTGLVKASFSSGGPGLDGQRESSTSGTRCQTCL
jgi:hypothetical protein